MRWITITAPVRQHRRSTPREPLDAAQAGGKQAQRRPEQAGSGCKQHPHRQRQQEACAPVLERGGVIVAYKTMSSISVRGQ